MDSANSRSDVRAGPGVRDAGDRQHGRSCDGAETVETAGPLDEGVDWGQVAGHHVEVEVKAQAEDAGTNHNRARRAVCSPSEQGEQPLLHLKPVSDIAHEEQQPRTIGCWQVGDGPLERGSNGLGPASGSPDHGDALTGSGPGERPLDQVVVVEAAQRNGATAVER